MKKYLARVTIVLLVLIMALGIRSPALAQNQIDNWSFELGTAGWAASGGSTTISHSSTYALFGTYSLKVEPDAYVWSGTMSDLTLVDDTIYTLSAWVKGSSGKPYFLALYDNTDTSNIIVKTFTGTGEWQKVEGTGTTVNGGSHTVRIFKNNDANTDDYYIDGCSLEVGGMVIDTDGDVFFYDDVDVPSEVTTKGVKAQDSSGLAFKTDEGATRMVVADDGIVDIDTLNVWSSAQVGSNLDVDNNADVAGTLNVDGNTTMASLDVTGDLTVGGSVDVEGDVECRDLYLDDPTPVLTIGDATISTEADDETSLTLRVKTDGAVMRDVGVLVGWDSNVNGNTRGEGATDFGNRTSAVYVASGDFSTVSGGKNNQALGDYSAVPGGYSNTASGDYSVAMGYDATARHYGSVAMGSGHAQQVFATSWDTGITITNTWVAVALDGDSEHIAIPNDYVYVVECQVQMTDESPRQIGAYRIVGVATQEDGTPSILMQTVTTLYEHDTSWDVRLTVEDVDGDGLLYVEVKDGEGEGDSVNVMVTWRILEGQVG